MKIVFIIVLLTDFSFGVSSQKRFADPVHYLQMVKKLPFIEFEHRLIVSNISEINLDFNTAISRSKKTDEIKNSKPLPLRCRKRLPAKYIVRVAKSRQPCECVLPGELATTFKSPYHCTRNKKESRRL
jgi:hypothetical protein